MEFVDVPVCRGGKGLPSDSVSLYRDGYLYFGSNIKKFIGLTGDRSIRVRVQAALDDTAIALVPVGDDEPHTNTVIVNPNGRGVRVIHALKFIQNRLGGTWVSKIYPAIKKDGKVIVKIDWDKSEE